MAYDLVKQTHPGAPCAIGVRVTDAETGAIGTIVQPLPGHAGVRARFDGKPFPIDCDPGRLVYADPAPVPAPAEPWCLQ